MEEMVGNQMSIPPGMEEAAVKPVVQGVTASPHAILVDQSGLRYMNEGGSYMAYCQGMLARNKTVPAVPSWAIMDSQFMKNYALITPLPGTKKPQEWYDSGFLKKADTIEELAGLLNIDPATLRGTVDRFNGFVAQNRDDDFHRGERAYDRWLGDIYHEKNASLGSIGEVLSREYLMKHVWKTDYTGDTRTIEVHMRWLRETIEVDANKPCYLQTVRGVGYRLNVEASK